MCTVNSLLPCVSSDNELKFRCGVLQFGSLSFITWNPSTCFIKKKNKTTTTTKTLKWRMIIAAYNFYSWEKKAWKKIRLVRDSNPWPLRHWCNLYQLNCTGIAEVEATNPVRAGIFFQAFFSQLQRLRDNCHDHPSFNSSLRSSHNMIFIYSKLHLKKTLMHFVISTNI